MDNTSPLTDSLSEVPVTPETTSAGETPSTSGTQKRWNLRQRRTRSGDGGDKDEEDTTVDSTLTSSQSSVTEESPVQTTPPKRQRRGTKRVGPKVQSTTAKRKTPAKRNTPAATPTNNAEAMFNAVFSGKGALKNVASEWVDRYEDNPEGSMLELIQFLVRCCGCKGKVSDDMFKSDTTEAIRSLTENFAETTYDYPLIMIGPQQKRFKNNFCEFIWRLIEQCQHSIIYDEYMLDTLIVWLVGFTDSQVRAFRHTSSLASIKLVSALITIANTVTAEIDNTQRQVEAERKRQLSKKTEAGLAKLEILLSKQNELKTHKTELEDTMKGLFSSVFVHRYRDVRPEIRAICIIELGVWLKDYSVKFLADSYLKYIGWMLFDKVGDVRHSCLKVLENLYSDMDIAPHMELFTDKFKSRLLSMRLDVDDHAAVSAINVLCHMQNLNLLDAEECQEVCELVFLEHRGISHAAGHFAVGYLFSEDFMSKAKLKKVPKGHKKPTDGEITLSELIKFFVEVKIHDHANYFVDSLWEHTDALQDWESMCSLLLGEKCGIVLTDIEETVLVEIMACSVRRATGATPPAGRAKGKVLSSKEKRTVESSRQELSSYFMEKLPDLIAKFGTSATNATNLANIPQHFELELYAENRQQKQLESLLTHLHQLTMKHLEPEVLSECAQTVKCLMDPEFSLHSTSDLSFRQLMDELVASFKQYLTDCDQQTLMDEEDEDCFSFAVATRRLAAFYRYIDISDYEFSEEMAKLLKDGAKNRYAEKILENAVVCCKHEVLWAVHELDKATNVERDSLRKVRTKMLQLFKSCQHLLKSANGAAQREAFVTFADLLVLFSGHLSSSNPSLSSLVYEPDHHLQECLEDYVLSHILHSTDDDTDFEPSSEEEALVMAERLNDRRVQLAAYLKLGIYCVIDMKRLAPVWAQYITQFPNFGDLIKLSMNRSREKNPILWYKTVVTCLKQCFLAHKEENGFVDQLSGEWTEIKELAKKFAQSMGIEPMRVRRPLVGIHREGVLFAIQGLDAEAETDEFESTDPPPNIDFFMILTEFSHRLLGVDRKGEKGVIPFLIEHLPTGLIQAIQDKRLQGWDSLLFYWRHTSSPQMGKGKSLATAGVSRSVVHTHGRARKRPLRAVNVSTSSEPSVSRPTKMSRIETTPPSRHDSEESEAATPPLTRRTRRRRTAVTAES